MGAYLRTPEMTAGGPFRCYNCGRLLIQSIEGGDYVVRLLCHICKAQIVITMRQPVRPSSATSAPASASDANGSRPATPVSTGRSP